LPYLLVQKIVSKILLFERVKTVLGLLEDLRAQKQNRSHVQEHLLVQDQKQKAKNRQQIS
jgi:hypothetical protein